LAGFELAMIQELGYTPILDECAACARPFAAGELGLAFSAAVGGVAPFALASALLVGLLLAAGIARPLRALATRAEAMAARQTTPLTHGAERDEVRGLTRSFDRMLEGLAESERQRLAAERVAAWQEVARRVAHEVRNALSPIGLAVENLRRTHARAPAEFDRSLAVETATILEEVESLRALVEEFSRFARLPAPQCAPCDLAGRRPGAWRFWAPARRRRGLGDRRRRPHP
jgi:nitrogen fixation/metabolism regulation signal transduction histidine kinase